MINLDLVTIFRHSFPKWSKASKFGLLCRGGDLSAERLLAAYSSGIFPWFDHNLPIMWWTPNPRCIMPINGFHLPKRSKRAIKKLNFTLTFNQAFEQVIQGCIQQRINDEGTWICDGMPEAYCRLNELGFAHSIETWQDGKLVGGLYGVGMERAFFGESMFHIVSEASRYALFGLITLLKQRNCVVLDCQQETPHMVRMGAILVNGRTFQGLLRMAGLGQAGELKTLTPWFESYEFDVDSSSWRLKSK